MDAGSVIAAVVISFDGFALAKIYFRFVLIDAWTSALYKVLGVSHQCDCDEKRVVRSLRLSRPDLAVR